MAGSWRTAPLPPDWPTIRAAILERDHHRCTWTLPSGAPCGAPATDVDHTGHPADHNPAALRALCTPHHRARTGRQGAQAAAVARARRPRARPHEPHPGIT